VTLTDTDKNVEILYLQEPGGVIHLHDRLEDVELDVLGDLPFGLRVIVDDGGTDDPEGDFSMTRDVEDVLAQLRHVIPHVVELNGHAQTPVPDLVALRVTRDPSWTCPVVMWSYEVWHGGGGGSCPLRESECEWCHPELEESDEPPVSAAMTFSTRRIDEPAEEV
jgi:hypothetical protein